MPTSSKLQLIRLPSSLASEPKRDWQLIRKERTGFPGRTLGHLYSSLANELGTFVNTAAVHRGMGPKVAADAIAAFFGQQRWQHDSLAEICVPPDVLQACDELTRFAFRTQTPRTQLAAFHSIVAISTQFPGLKIFLKNSAMVAAELQHSGDSDTLLNCWDRQNSASCDLRWHFFCEFAATCITDRDIFPIIKGVSRVALASGDAQESGLSLIEQLINSSIYEPTTPFHSHLSIRYLTGILELQYFWNHLRLEQQNPHRQLYMGIACKLLKRATLLLQDLGVDEHEPSPDVSLVLDEEGVDGFCQAILSGMENAVLCDWCTHREESELLAMDQHPLHRELQNVIHLLRLHRSSLLVPKSQQLALDDVYVQFVHLRQEKREIMIEELSKGQALQTRSERGADPPIRKPSTPSLSQDEYPKTKTQSTITESNEIATEVFNGKETVDTKMSADAVPFLFQGQASMPGHLSPRLVADDLKPENIQDHAEAAKPESSVHSVIQVSDSNAHYSSNNDSRIQSYQPPQKRKGHKAHGLGTPRKNNKNKNSNLRQVHPVLVANSESRAFNRGSSTESHGHGGFPGLGAMAVSLAYAYLAPPVRRSSRPIDLREAITSEQLTAGIDRNTIPAHATVLVSATSSPQYPLLYIPVGNMPTTTHAFINDLGNRVRSPLDLGLFRSLPQARQETVRTYYFQRAGIHAGNLWAAFLHGHQTESGPMGVDLLEGNVYLWGMGREEMGGTWVVSVDVPRRI